MKKIIEVDLDNKFEYVNKFDDNVINYELLKYLLISLDDFKRDVIIRIKFNYDVLENDICQVEDMFKRSFLIELDNIKKELRQQNVKNILLLLFGFIALIIYCCLDDGNIFLVAEFFMVISWVLFWEFAESILFRRRELALKRKKYKKLMDAEFKIITKVVD